MTDLPPGAVQIEDLKEEDFKPKWYLNGFPKSGLHWLALLMLPVARPLFDDHDLWSQPWAGTFRDNSWTNDGVPSERVCYKIGRLRDGHYLKGHCGYRDDIERFLWYSGIATIFLYRDPRDVAVSQAFHVLSEDDDKMAHPDKDLYRSMDSFEDVLRAVIIGVEGFPGVMARWANYTGWLDVDWILKLRFEEIKANPHATAIKILRYGLHRASGIFGLEPNIVEDNLDTVAGWMVKAGERTDKSPTFRKGAVGDWHEYFTPELKRLFAETDRDGWLERLGYEW